MEYVGRESASPSDKDLLTALKQGDPAAARRLIRSGAPVNAVDDLGSSALIYAAIYSDLATMRLLLDKGADPNHADKSGATALMWSVPDEDKVRLLVAHGADVNVTSSVTAGRPSLWPRGCPGAARIVKFLLDKRRDTKIRDKVGFTPRHRAAFNGYLEIVKLLIDREQISTRAAPS